MWSDEDVIELIGLYREKPVLWDFSHPQHYKKNIKTEAWEDIALSLKRDAEQCSNKIINLLASYRRERAKVKSDRAKGRGGGKTYQSRWYAYEAMDFLHDRKDIRSIGKRRNREITNEAGGSTCAEKKPELVTPIPQPPKIKKKKEINRVEMLTEAIDVLNGIEYTPTHRPSKINSNNFDDETLFFSKFICCKMQNYQQSTKNAVQRAIMDILFKADEGNTNFSKKTYPVMNNDRKIYASYTVAPTKRSESPQSSTASPDANANSQSTDSDSSEDFIIS